MKRIKRGFILLLILVLFVAPNLVIKSTAHATDGISLVVKDNQGTDLLNESNLTNDSNPETALDLLKSEAQKANMTVDAPNSSFGPYIKTIGKGTTHFTQSNDNYWAFFLNGVQSFDYPTYKPKAGDQLLYEFIPSSGIQSDEVSIAVNSKYGTLIKLDQGATILSMLQKFEGSGQVTVEANKITSIAGKSADASHVWQVLLNRNGKDQTVSDLSTPVQGKDQIFFNLVSKTVASNAKTVSSSQLTNAINQAASYVNKNGISDWSAVALSKAGKTLPSSYLSGIDKSVKASKGKFDAITDTERTVLGVLAAGGDPTNVSGYNLVKSIYNGDVTENNTALNGVIYGLIALDSTKLNVPSNAKWTTNKMVDYILKHQNSDGGWAWDLSAKTDLDTTGMALIALSKESSSAQVQSAVKKAETYLSNSFKQSKVDNSSTATQLIIGLTANDVNPEGSDYTMKDGTTLLSYLLTFQQKDGGFNWQSNDESIFSTEQGIEALVADQLYREKNGSLYTFTLKTASAGTSNAASSTKKTSAGPSSKQTGSSLPETATNYYNYVVVGLILAVIGVMINRFYKRRFQ